MYQGTHAAVVGDVLLLGLTACSDDATTAQFNPSQLSQALPGKLGVPQGGQGKQPQVVDGKESDDLQLLAKLQVDRIRTAAAGKNPDAS